MVIQSILNGLLCTGMAMKRENFGLNPETALTIHYGASLHCSSVSYCTNKGFKR